MQTQTNTTKMPVKRDFIVLPPAVGDRITFRTPDDGIQAGFISAFRSHLGNGEVFAWVELDQEWTGTFRGVPLRDIETADGFGSGADFKQTELVIKNLDWRKQFLCDFTSSLSRQPTEAT